MTHDDILCQIPGYVLGLLPARQYHVVERHVSHCSVCQQEMSRERKLDRLVQSTMDAASKPNPAHLRSLMPDIPLKRPSALVFGGWQRQLAPALLILLLLFGGLAINSMLPAGSVPAFVATAHAATATSTYTPTATMAQAISESEQTNDELSVSDSYVKKLSIPKPSTDTDPPVETPDPLPTPIASIRQTVQ
jgi:anti-sigma factor RsiW